jgi:circadian clock protein KaiC
LDPLISGGLLRNKTFLVAGETGTGKTVFSLKFLLKGISEGEPGLYLPFDETIQGTIEGALTLGWDLEDPIRKNMLRILDVRPFFAEIVREKFMAEIVKKVVGELKRHVDQIHAKRLVIDPVAPLMGEVVDVSWTRDYIRGFVAAVENFLGCTTIITSEVPTGSETLSRFGVEEFLSSGIIKLAIANVNNRSFRTIQIRKMRWTWIDLERYVYDIKPLEGIVVKGPLHKVAEEA